MPSDSLRHIDTHKSNLNLKTYHLKLSASFNVIIVQLVRPTMGDSLESPSGSTAQALTAVAAFEKSGFNEILYRPGTAAYETRMSSYYSRGSSQLRPWAVIQPRTTEEVSAVVKTLVRIPGCQIAVRRSVLPPYCFTLGGGGGKYCYLL